MTGLPSRLSRRSLLGLIGAAAGAFGTIGLAACAGQTSAPTAAPAAAPPAAPTSAPAAGSTPTAAPVAATSPKSKSFAGSQINVYTFEHIYGDGLKALLPEFEKTSGIKVNFTQGAFAVYNQRADLNLATHGSAWDVLCVTYVFAQKWIGAGWFTNLLPYAKDPQKTPASWNPDDFISGSLIELKDEKGNLYGYPWNIGVMLQGAARGDILRKAGFKEVPQTMDELKSACEKMKPLDTTLSPFVADNLHHWNWPPYLMAFGGSIFKDPPNDLTPTLDTPQAIEAAGFYGDLLQNYAPAGALSYTDDQAMTDQVQGRANIRTQAVDWLVPLSDPAKTKFAKDASYGFTPKGKGGWFPGVNSHGYGLPAGAKNKDAGWEFIKWALSREMVLRLAVEHTNVGVARTSVINDPKYKAKYQLNGQDVPAMFLKVANYAGDKGYMKYRIVPQFPVVGDAINKTIDRIVSKQQSPADAMKQLQSDAVAALQKAGVKVKG